MKYLGVKRVMGMRLIRGPNWKAESQNLRRFVYAVVALTAIAFAAAHLISSDKKAHKAEQTEGGHPAFGAKAGPLTDTEIAAAQQACRENDTSACLVAANESREFERIQLAISNLKWICSTGKHDVGTAGACYKLALFYDASNVPSFRDPELAAAYFGQACSSGHMRACFEAASRALWVKGDELEAFTMIKSACARWKKTASDDPSFTAMCDYARKTAQPDEELWAKASAAILTRDEDGFPVYVLGKASTPSMQRQAASEWN